MEKLLGLIEINLLFFFFSNIKKAKSTFSNTPIGKELDQEKINNNFDYMAKQLAAAISHQLNINTWSRGSFKIPSPQEILDILSVIGNIKKNLLFTYIYPYVD